MSEARKRKPVKLKDSVESGKADFDVKEFLGKGPKLKAMTPSSYHPTFEPPASHATSPENDETAVIDPFQPKANYSQSLRLAETQNPTHEFSKTLPLPGSGVLDRPSAMFNSPGASYEKTDRAEIPKTPEKKKSSVKWIDPNAVVEPKPAPKVKAKPKQSNSMAPVIMVIGALGLIAYVALSSSSPSGSVSKKLSPDELKERIEFHQKTTGWRLNNERIATQIDNHYKAPNLPAGAEKVKPKDSMMSGVPLQGETNPMEGMRDQSMPVNPTYADAKIMYGLQEEQDRIETEKRARKAYIQEFIDNAAADGYDVQIDKSGNYKVKKLKPEDRPQPPDEFGE